MHASPSLTCGMLHTAVPCIHAIITLYYTISRTDGPPFTFPITAFYGDADRRVTEAHVRGWARFTRGAFACTRMEGHHLWPLQRGPKTAWLQAIANGLTGLAGGGRGTGHLGTGTA